MVKGQYTLAFAISQCETCLSDTPPPTTILSRSVPWTTHDVSRLIHYLRDHTGHMYSAEDASGEDVMHYINCIALYVGRTPDDVVAKTMVNRSLLHYQEHLDKPAWDVPLSWADLIAETHVHGLWHDSLFQSLCETPVQVSSYTPWKCFQPIEHASKTLFDNALSMACAQMSASFRTHLASRMRTACFGHINKNSYRLALPPSERAAKQRLFTRLVTRCFFLVTKADGIKKNNVVKSIDLMLETRAALEVAEGPGEGRASEEVLELLDARLRKDEARVLWATLKFFVELLQEPCHPHNPSVLIRALSTFWNQDKKNCHLQGGVLVDLGSGCNATSQLYSMLEAVYWLAPLMIFHLKHQQGERLEANNVLPMDQYVLDAFQNTEYPTTIGRLEEWMVTLDRQARLHDSEDQTLPASLAHESWKERCREIRHYISPHDPSLMACTISDSEAIERIMSTTSFGDAGGLVEHVGSTFTCMKRTLEQSLLLHSGIWLQCEDVRDDYDGHITTPDSDPCNHPPDHGASLDSFDDVDALFSHIQLHDGLRTKYYPTNVTDMYAMAESDYLMEEFEVAAVVFLQHMQELMIITMGHQLSPQLLANLRWKDHHPHGGRNVFVMANRVILKVEGFVWALPVPLGDALITFLAYVQPLRERFLISRTRNFFAITSDRRYLWTGQGRRWGSAGHTRVSRSRSPRYIPAYHDCQLSHGESGNMDVQQEARRKLSDEMTDVVHEVTQLCYRNHGRTWAFSDSHLDQVEFSLFWDDLFGFDCAMVDGAHDKVTAEDVGDEEQYATRLSQDLVDPTTDIETLEYSVEGDLDGPSMQIGAEAGAEVAL